MPWLRKHALETVRPRSALKISVLLCVLISGLTAAVVYGLGRNSWTPTNSNPTYTATAYVVERAAKTTAAEVRIPLAYTDADAHRAEEVANGLAEQYVHDRRAQWQRQTEESCQKAHDASENARNQYVESQARLEAFRREMAATEKSPAAVKEPETPPIVDNPRWLDLDRQVAALQRRYDALLVNRTPAHRPFKRLQGRSKTSNSR